MKKILLCILAFNCGVISLAADKAKEDESKKQFKEKYVKSINNGVFKKTIPADETSLLMGLFIEKTQFPLFGLGVEQQDYIKKLAITRNNEFIQKYRSLSSSQKSTLAALLIKEDTFVDVGERLKKKITSEEGLNNFKMLLHWECCMKNTFDVLHSQT